MGIVAAGMHDAHGFAAEGGRDLGGEGQAAAFGHRQRVHVGAQGDPRAGLAAAQHRGHAGGGDAGADFLEPQCAQMLRDQLCRAHFAIAEFRMLVDVAPPRLDLAIHLGGQRFHLRVGGERGARHEREQRSDQQRMTHHGDLPRIRVDPTPRASASGRASTREQRLQARFQHAASPAGQWAGPTATILQRFQQLARGQQAFRHVEFAGDG